MEKKEAHVANGDFWVTHYALARKGRNSCSSRMLLLSLPFICVVVIALQIVSGTIKELLITLSFCKEFNSLSLWFFLPC